MREVPEVENVYVIGGVQPARHARAAPRHDHRRPDPQVRARAHARREIEEILLDKLDTVPDLRAYFVNDRGERQLAFGVMGTDGAVLDKQARKIQSEMNATGKFRAVSSNAALDRPEVIIVPDLERLAELGISTATLSETLRVATIGDIDANLAKFTVGDRQIPIRVQLNEKAKDDLSVVSTLAGADRFGRVGAAVVGRRDPLRPGPVLDPALQPRAPRRHQRRHGAGRRAQRGARASSGRCRR